MVSVLHRTIIATLCLGMLYLAPSPASGQSASEQAGDDPVLESLIAEALARNPDLHAAQSAIAAAQTSLSGPARCPTRWCR